MSDVAVAWAKAQDCPTRPSKPILAFAASWANAAGEGWVAVEVLAVELQVDVRSIQRGLAELRAAGLMLDTGKFEVWQGKRYPIFRLPLEKGFQNTAQKLRAMRAAEAARGDSSVTPTAVENDTSVTPRGDAAVTQKGKGKGKRSSNELPPARADEVEAFEEAFAAYEARGQARTHRPHALRLFRPILAEIGREAATAMVRRYVAEDPDLRRGTYGAPAFDTWLESERWRRWLPKAKPQEAFRTGFVGPAELRAAVVAHAGEEFATSYLDRCGWDPLTSALTPPHGFARAQLERRVGHIIAKHGASLAPIERVA